MKKMFLGAAVGLLLATLNACLATADAQNTVFTYQGRVTDNGTNFTGTGQFQFALVTSTNANQTATATVGIGQPSGGYITGYLVTAGGNGYVAAPTVIVSGGGGVGATAIAHLTGGSVTSVTVSSPGNGAYTSAPTVLIAPPPANLSYATYWSNDGTSSAGSEPAAAVNVAVSNGLFTVVLGDTTVANMTALSTTIFTQPNLQLRIWFNDGVNGSAVLSPLQNLTPTPYAIMANTASNLLGSLSATQLSGIVANGVLPASPNFSGTVTAGSLAGNGANVTNVNAAALGGLPATNFWQLGGNNVAPGQFLGSTNNQPVEFWVNNGRGLRLQSTAGAPDLIGGAANNVIANGTTAAVIGGGSNNTIAAAADFGVIAGGDLNVIQTNSAYSVIGGGDTNTIFSGATYSVISGGDDNWIETNAYNSFIGGGSLNNIQNTSGQSVIVGGRQNSIQANAATCFIGGGYLNNIYEVDDFIGAGFDNNIYGDASFIGGGGYNQIAGNGYTDESSFLGGGENNSIQLNAFHSFLGAGNNNIIGTNASYSVLAGGAYNSIKSPIVNAYETLGGGLSNSVGGVYSTIGGGIQNVVTLGSGYGFIGGGSGNVIDANSQFSTIAGGVNNYIATSAGAGAIGGGQANAIQVSAAFGTIPGGYGNLVNNNANYSLAAGYYAAAMHPGSFVWADNSVTQYATSIANNSWTVRSIGGARFISAVNVSGTPTAGVSLAAGGGAWTSLSDRNAKEHFADVDAKNILDKVAALPVLTWNYKTQDPAIRHIGPMAQDFKAAFKVGESDTGITTVDEDGVALAAIQGLNQKLKEQKAENVELKARLEKLEKLILEQK